MTERTPEEINEAHGFKAGEYIDPKLQEGISQDPHDVDDADEEE